MRRRQAVCSIAAALLGFVVSQASLGQNAAGREHHYRLIDLGTFGGPHGQVNSGSIVINKHREVAGGASTFDFPFCFYVHSFRWRDGKLIDLGTSPAAITVLPMESTTLAQSVAYPKTV
jgi:hypothetical protein